MAPTVCLTLNYLPEERLKVDPAGLFAEVTKRLPEKISI